MASVSRVAGTAGSFTYRLNVAPDAPPTVRYYADAARTVEVRPAAPTTPTDDPAAFTVAYDAALAAGTYYLTLTSVVGGVTHVDADDSVTLIPVTGGVGDTGVVPWRPSVLEVQALIARRGPFTSTSRPSVAEVESIIDRLVGEVRAELTGPLPSTLHTLARSAVAYGAAALVEQSFTPEQSLGDDGPAAQLYARYVATLGRLRALAGRLGLTLDPFATDGTGGTVDPGAGRTYRSGTLRTPSGTELDARDGYVVTSPPDPYVVL